MSKQTSSIQMLEATASVSNVKLARQLLAIDHLDITMDMHADNDELFQQCSRVYQLVREIEQLRIEADGEVDDSIVLTAVEKLESATSENPLVHLLTVSATRLLTTEQIIDPQQTSDARLRSTLLAAHGQDWDGFRIFADEETGFERWATLQAESTISVRIASANVGSAHLPVDVGLGAEAAEQVAHRHACGWPAQGLGPVFEQVVFL